MCFNPSRINNKKGISHPRRGNSLEREAARDHLRLQEVPAQAETPARSPGQPRMSEFCCLHVHVHPRNALPCAEVQLLIWIKSDSSLQQRDQD